MPALWSDPAEEEAGLFAPNRSSTSGDQSLFLKKLVDNEAQFDDFFRAIDQDRSGKITYNEWVAATMQKAVVSEDATIRKAFQYFDLDQTGCIHMDELELIRGSGGDKYPMLPFPGEISYRCFTGHQKYF